MRPPTNPPPLARRVFPNRGAPSSSIHSRGFLLNYFIPQRHTNKFSFIPQPDTEKVSMFPCIARLLLSVLRRCCCCICVFSMCVCVNTFRFTPFANKGTRSCRLQPPRAHTLIPSIIRAGRNFKRRPSAITVFHVSPCFSTCRRAVFQCFTNPSLTTPTR